mmetsp:Transcript_11035/g.33846  ORF Transcript_11035/g.33846 Transcript_11035/m.33846 type:complete len:543 (-) Transcript_11035:223-1851(-)
MGGLYVMKLVKATKVWLNQTGKPSLRAKSESLLQRVQQRNKGMVLAVLMLAAVVLVVHVRNVKRTFSREEIEAISVYPYGNELVSPRSLYCLGWDTGKELVSCEHKVEASEAGSCIVTDSATGNVFKVGTTSPGIYHNRGVFTCKDEYIDFVNFRIGANRLVEKENLIYDVSADESRPQELENTKRGIVLAAYNRIFPSAYALIRHLRDIGCKLPIELWSRQNELRNVSVHVDELVNKHNVTTRKVLDPEISGFFVKIHAIAESSFDEVLFVDSDNFPVRDPSYLFDLPEYRKTGALFWPDFWHPNHSIFDMSSGGVAWELFGVSFRFEMEQESGQVVIDRHRGRKALRLMKYYARSFGVVSRLKAVWGDKDLFRLSFRRTGTPYYMIPTLPALAGRFLSPDSEINNAQTFCGQTMVQHDPAGEMLFLHRNTAKLNSDFGSLVTWEQVQKYNGRDMDKFVVKVAPRGTPYTCWYIPEAQEGPWASPKYERLPYREMEKRIIVWSETIERKRPGFTRFKRRLRRAMSKSHMKSAYGVSYDRTW